MKVLNLYACLGGNRLLWDNCEVTAVELDSELARLYKERFPNDTVIVADAHQYLLEHYKEFDFIWSSPPCPTHSRARFWGHKKTNPVYPDMKLYEEIVFLQHHALPNQKWVVENVIPYYEPLIPAKKQGRHLFWSNFTLPIMQKKDVTGQMNVDSNRINMQEYHKVNIDTYKGKQSKTKILRNLVDYEVGNAIYQRAKGIELSNKQYQKQLF